MTYTILKINNINIERVTDFNFLGLMIPFCAFKSNIKQRIISTYSEKCVIPFCDSCKIVTENS